MYKRQAHTSASDSAFGRHCALKRILFSYLLAYLLTNSAAYFSSYLVCCRPHQYDDGTEIETCTFKLDRHLYLTYYMADLVIFYVIPLFLTCLLYALIARILLMSTRQPGTPGSLNASPDSQATRSSSGLTTARIRRSTSSTSSRVQVYC